MSLMLQQAVASSLYDSMVAANNVFMRNMEITFTQFIPGNKGEVVIVFKYIEGFGVSLRVAEALTPDFLGATTEHYRNQAEFASAYGLA